MEVIYWIIKKIIFLKLDDKKKLCTDTCHTVRYHAIQTNFLVINCLDPV